MSASGQDARLTSSPAATHWVKRAKALMRTRTIDQACQSEKAVSSERCQFKPSQGKGRADLTEVDKDGVADAPRRVVSRERVVRGAHGRGDEDGKDEGDDVVARDEDVDEDGVQDTDEGEAPADAVDDVGRVIEELIDDEAEQEDVAAKRRGKRVSGKTTVLRLRTPDSHDGPGVEDIVGGGEVGIPAVAVRREGPASATEEARGSAGSPTCALGPLRHARVDVGGEEEGEGQDVDDLRVRRGSANSGAHDGSSAAARVQTAGRGRSAASRD